MQIFSILMITGVLILSSQQVYSQKKYPKDYFRSPMGIPLVLAGNFAELRTNHFHTGLDIKTNGKEGYKLYSCADGYISRINISHWGYGKVIYVDHPNGYTTVYAHCSEFPKHIEAFVRKAQRDKETESITLYPGPEQFQVKKGDVIAYSGNSGSSSAPHLHFEIRDTKTEEPLNPLLFGFEIPDNVPPSIYGIKLYSFDAANIMGAHKDRIVKASGSSLSTPVITANGTVGMAIHTVDKLSGASNKCGIYTIELFDNNELVFKQTMEKLSFYTNRYINAHMDYLEYRYRKNSYHKSFLSENNQLPIYSDVKNNGFIDVKPGETHQMKYIVTDSYGNKSTLKFTLKGDKTLKPKAKSDSKDFDASKKNDLIRDDFKAYLPSKSLYDDAEVEFSEQPALNHSKSPVYHFNTDSIPIQKYFVLKIKAMNVNPEHQNKALIAEVSKDRRRVYAKSSTTNDGWITTKVRSFGDYTVMIDTTRPFIGELNISNNKYKKTGALLLKISDNLSGIESYKAYVDGKWVHSYYTPKTAKLRIPFDNYNNIEAGSHTLKVVVTDERKNTREFEIPFTR